MSEERSEETDDRRERLGDEDTVALVVLSPA